MTSSRRPFREFDDSYDAESLRMARRVVRGLTMSMQHIVVAPGSRSAPLAYALREAEELGAITVHIRIDERSAAFTALGLAMATGRPTGVVTTSGTAAGNLLPAVMEAELSGVPLAVITADRPEELHGTGANQTTWQQGMFAGRVRDEVHLEQSDILEGHLRLEPASRDDLMAVETQVGLLMRQATASSATSVPGPVHLNIGFRDPLVPTGISSTQQALQRWARKPFLPAEDRETAAPQQRIDDFDLGTFRTAFVFGHDAPAEAVGLAQQLGHPILAEPSSGARWSDTGAVQGYRLLLQAPEGSAAAELREQVQRVVVVGRPTLTRPVQQLIRRRDVQAVQYAPRRLAWSDERLPRRSLRELDELAEFAGRAPAGWQEAWQEKGIAAQRMIDAALGEQEQLSSVRAAQFVAETVRTPLLLGSSSVIRDVDLAAALTRPAAEPGAGVGATGVGGAVGAAADRGAEDRRIYALRGVSGIDGNLSAAAGVALHRQRRVTALVGDLTFLHDLNTLLVPSTEERPHLDIVVINDGGGAIFDQLEHGEVGRRRGNQKAVERFFGTPQSVEIEQLVIGFGHEHRRAETVQDLEAALAGPDDRVGVRVIEVRTDRAPLRDFHAELTARAAEL